MAIKSLQNSNTSLNSTSVSQKSVEAIAKSMFNKQYTTFTPSTEWPTLIVPSTSTQQIQMLVAVYPDSHYLAFNCAGAYNVNWGDSTSENVATGVQSNHTYTYSTLSGTVTSGGYKVVTVTITPQSGQNLTTFNTQVKNTTTGLSAYDTQILDMVISMPSGTSITIGASTLTVAHRSLERVRITSSALTSVASLFINCTGLITYDIFSSVNITSMASMCSGCVSLTYANYFNTQYVTTTANAFDGCNNLLSTANFNFNSCTSTSSMFVSCRNLIFIPFWNLPVVTSTASMFSGCISLIYSPNFYFPLLTSAAAMFNGCSSLIYVPELRMPLVTTLSQLFISCVSLSKIPNMYCPEVTNLYGLAAGCTSLKISLFSYTSKATDVGNMYQSCASLLSVPTMDVSAALTLTNMFYQCYSIKNIAFVNMNNCSTFNSTFLGCSSLQTIAGLNFAKATDITSMVQSCSQLASISNIAITTIPSVVTAEQYNQQPYDIALHPNGIEAYVMHPGGPISHLRWNAAAGRFVKCAPRSLTAGNSYFCAISPDGSYLFAGNNSSTLFSMPINSASGYLSSISSNTGGNGRIGISPDGQKMYNSTGASPSTIYYYYRSSPSGGISTTGNLAAGLQTYDTVVSADNLFLYVPTGGNGQLKVYSINQTTAAITQVFSYTSFYDTQRVSISADNAYLYVHISAGQGGGIAVYSRNTITGAITLIQNVTVTKGQTHKLVFSSDGTFAYAGNIGSNSAFTVFSRDTGTGFLTQLAYYPTMISISAVALSVDNAYLHIISSNNGCGIVSIPLNTTTGLPTASSPTLLTVTSAFIGCANLKALPQIDMSIMGWGTNPTDSTLTSTQSTGFKSVCTPIVLNSSKLSKSGLNTYIENLQRPYAAPQTLQISTNPGYNARTLTGATWTTTSLSASCANTSTLSVGDSLYGTFNRAVAGTWTFTSGTNLVSYAGTSLKLNNSQISFTALTNAQGLGIYYPYYIINVSGNTFQLAYASGSTTPIQFENGSSTSAYFEVRVASITSLTTFTIDNYPMIAGSNASLTVAGPRVNYGFMNGWTVS